MFCGAVNDFIIDLIFFELILQSKTKIGVKIRQLQKNTNSPGGD
jgi:hypothetical protein